MHERTELDSSPRNEQRSKQGDEQTNHVLDPNIHPFMYLSSLISLESEVRTIESSDLIIEIRKNDDPKRLFQMLQVNIYKGNTEIPREEYFLSAGGEVKPGLRHAVFNEYPPLVKLPKPQVPFPALETRQEYFDWQSERAAALARFVRDQLMSDT